MITTTTDIKTDVLQRVQWIKDLLLESGANGIVYGASGGKDSVLVSILCRMATENVLGVIMPCQSKRNYGVDRDDAIEVCKKYDIPTVEVDLTAVKESFTNAVKGAVDEQNTLADININPRLRMTTLYNIAQRKNYLVAGTGNRSEIVMGYFTKWGDGSADFNVISDLTVREVYAMLNFLEAPESIITKAPSAGLSDEQTDEKELGLTYNEIDDFILSGTATDKTRKIIEDRYNATAHKRKGVRHYLKDNG